MKLSFRRADWLMIGVVIALLTASCLFIHSAAYRNTDHALGGRAVRQAVWAVLGLACYSAAAATDYRRLRNVHWWLYAGTVILLALVLLFGMSIYGARRWFSLGSITLQPSELAKLAVIFTLAARLGNPATDIESLKTLGLAFLIAGLPFLLIAAEPDLGSAMMTLPILFLLLFCAGVPLRPLLWLGGIGGAAAAALTVWVVFFPETCPFLTDYQKNRILVFLNINEDPLGSGWNKLQSQIAVGSGGLLGKGYLKGTQNILGFLPKTVAPTDFIFSVVAEETGFAGSLLLLTLYATLILRCIQTAVVARDGFGRLTAAGVGILIFSHVFINIAMTIGLMPITGVPLPLMSYGGTFMITIMTALGLVQSIWLRRRI